MEEIIETIEVKSTKYVLLSMPEYAVLNERISEAMGFDVGLPTERYAPVVPMQAKVNINYDDEGNETYETIPVMQITRYVQENYPDTLTGLELVDSYIPYVPENVQL